MVRKFNPATMYEPAGKYYAAVEVNETERTVYSSGIVGSDPDGNIPTDPQQQIDLAWRNVAAFLQGCHFTTANLVRLKMHITRRDYIELSRQARIKHLGEHMHCAVTGVIGELFDDDLVIEIDVIAAG